MTDAGVELVLVVPDSIDDPARPSGGNVYDRRLAEELTGLGWTVHERPIAGAWPEPDAAARAQLATGLDAVPAGGLVLVDGLIGSAVPDLLTAERGRLRVAMLVHQPLGDARETAALAAADAVITTSDWARRQVVERVPDAEVSVARPGVDRAPLAPGAAGGGRLLCVAAVARHKGHDLLLDALARVGDQAWCCTCVGSVERDPGFVADLRRAPVAARVHFTGAAPRAAVAAAYAVADLLVVPSRTEAFGMVVTEALARGVPVVATDVGGLPEALGVIDGGRRPGLLVAPDATALAAALRRWLTDAGLRADLRAAAALHRTTLTGWDDTARSVAAALHATG